MTKHTFRSVIDIIDTKLYASKGTTIKKRSPAKYTLPINFVKKAVELTPEFRKS